MENTGYGAIRLDGNGFVGRALLFKAAFYFSAIVLVGCLSAAFAPDVLVEISSSRRADPAAARTVLNFALGVSPLSQVLSFSEKCATPQLVNTASVTLHQDISVYLYASSVNRGAGWEGCSFGCIDCVDDSDCIQLLDGSQHTRTFSCSEGSQYCSDVPLATVDFIEYDSYFLKVVAQPVPEFANLTSISYEYDKVYVNSAFTWWELTWKYIFLGLTLLATFTPAGIGFISRVTAGGWLRQTWHQRWVIVLLGLLLGFNNPLFAAQIYGSAGLELSRLHGVFQALFLSALLLFWIEIFLLTASLGAHRQSFCCRRQSNASGDFYENTTTKPKFHASIAWCQRLLVLCLFISLTALLMYMRVQQQFDPSFVAEDSSEYRALYICTAILAAVYGVWTSVLLYWSIRSFLGLSRAYKVMLVVTIFNLAALLLGLWLNATSPLQPNAALRTTWEFLPNLYVWSLAYGYGPEKYNSTQDHEEEVVGVCSRIEMTDTTDDVEIVI